MHRQPLIQLLKEYQPVDKLDEQLKQDTLSFVESTEDCFDRNNFNGHITAGAWILDETLSHVLLTHHRKMKEWLPLGGHCDDSNDVKAVSLKEAQEESGIMEFISLKEGIFDVDIYDVPQIGELPAHKHYGINFVWQADKAMPIKTSNESIEVCWISLENIHNQGPGNWLGKLRSKSKAVP